MTHISHDELNKRITEAGTIVPRFKPAILES